MSQVIFEAVPVFLSYPIRINKHIGKDVNTLTLVALVLNGAVSNKMSHVILGAVSDALSNHIWSYSRGAYPNSNFLPMDTSLD